MTAPIRGAEGHLLRGYGPLLALSVLVLSMAALAPTVAPERTVVTTTRVVPPPPPAAPHVDRSGAR